MTTITHTVSNLIASTFDNRRAELANNIFRFYPAFVLLREKGRIETLVGGEYAEYPVQIAQNETGRYIGRGGTVPLSDTEFTEIARYQWAEYAININNYFHDIRINRGKSRVYNLIDKKLKNATQSVADDLEESLADNPPSGSPVLTALSDIIKTSSQTSGTTGNIPRNSTTWYNQLTSMSGESSSIYLERRMKTMMNKCSIVGQGMKKQPDAIITTQTVYEFYEDELVEINIITNKAIKDLGFGGGLEYKGATMVWSPSFSDNQAGMMFFCNFDNIGVQIDPIANMRMTSWKAIPNQPFDEVAQMVVVLQLGCDCLQNQGVITTITTA